MSATELYQVFDADGSLLYVGISQDALHRLSQHRRKAWWSLAASWAIETFETRQAAEAAERTAIATEDPLHNIAHKPTKAPPAVIGDDWADEPYSFEAWKAAQLAKAPRMDEATARRVSAALFGTRSA